MKALDYVTLMSENRLKIMNLENSILTKFPGSYILVDSLHRIPNILNIVIPSLEVENLIGNAGFFSLSNGSACNSEIINNSYVVSELIGTDVIFSFRLSFDKVPFFSDKLLSEFNILLGSNVLNYA
jgi:cysteine desulfurase